MEEVFTYGSGSVWHDTEYNIIMVRFEGVMELKTAKQVFKTFHKKVGEFGSRKLLYDFREMEKSDPMARAWYVTSFMPKFVKAYGLKFRPAVLNVRKAYERMITDIVMKSLQKAGINIPVRFFEDYEEALEWLRND